MARDTRIAGAIIDSNLAMNYSAAGINQFDLAAGIDYLLTNQKNKNFPWLSANLVHKGKGKAPLPAYVIKETGEVKTAVIGLTDQLANTPGELLGEYGITPWQKALPPVMEQVRPLADIIILLSSYPIKDNETIAREIDGIHIIIQSGHSRSNMAPRLTNNTLICQTASKGKYLGFMNINWKPSGQWSNTGDEGLLQTTEGQLRGIERRLVDLEKRLTPEKLATDKRYQQLNREKTLAEQKISRLKENLARKDEDAPCLFNNTFVKIKSSIKEDLAVKSIVEKAKKGGDTSKPIRSSRRVKVY